MKLVVLANIRGTTRTCKEWMVKILKTLFYGLILGGMAWECGVGLDVDKAYPRKRGTPPSNGRMPLVIQGLLLPPSRRAYSLELLFVAEDVGGFPA